MGWSITQGIKQLQSDAPSENLSFGSSGTLNFKVLTPYKALHTMLRLKGTIKVESSSAVQNADTKVAIQYKDDHFYNLLSSFQFKADNDVIKDLQVNLAFFRFWLAYVQEGYELIQNIPSEVTIKNGETSAEVPYEVDIMIPFLMYDMLNIWQTALLTWLYKSIYANFKVMDADAVIKDVTSQNTTNLPQNNLSFSIVNPTAESYTDYDIVDVNYLNTNEAGKPLTQAEVLQKIGGYFKVVTQVQNFTAQGNNMFVKLLPTNIMLFKDLFVVVRDAATGERVDNVIDKITLKDGSRAIVDIDPRAIRNGDIFKYKINPNLFAKSNLTYPDGKGVLYGVYRIDGSNFNNLSNSKLATYSWNNPMLYFDINSNITSHTSGLNFEIIQCYKEVSDSMLKVANTFASEGNVSNIS